jgi:hypothetical protein
MRRATLPSRLSPRWQLHIIHGTVAAVNSQVRSIRAMQVIVKRFSLHVSDD